MSEYRVQIWCNDCLGSDPLGCFDGRRELLDGSYPTHELALVEGQAFEESNEGAPYSWRVVEIRETKP